MIVAHLPKTLHQTSPTIAQDVMETHELASLQLNATPTEETQFLQQEIQARFFAPHQPNDKCLIFHGLGSGKCVHPETVIQTEHGPVAIHALWDIYHDMLVEDPESKHAHWSTLRKPLAVMSYDICNEKMLRSSVTALYRQLIQEPIRVLTFQSGRQLTTTKQHRVRTMMGWSNDLQVGHSVLMQDEVWDTVTSVEYPDYMGYVYDIEVYRYHAYMANGYVTHNTCTAALIHERFKHLLLSRQKRPPALVILPSQHLASQWESEIFRICGKDTYTIPPELLVDLDEPLLGGETRRDRPKEYIRKVLKESYIFKGLDQFSAEIDVDKNRPEDAQWNQIRWNLLKAKYDGTDIIMDEAHRVQSKIHLFNKFFHALEGSRVFLMTGTPIWDRVSELPNLYNLLLPMDNQFEKPEQFVKEYYTAGTSEMRPEKKEEFKDRIRGLTSYLRTRLLDTRIRVEGVIHQGLAQYYPVFPCVMSSFQSDIVTRLWSQKEASESDELHEEPDEVDTPDLPTKASSILRDPRDAATFVFPDGSYGAHGFKEHIEFVAPAKGKGKKAQETAEQRAMYRYKDNAVLAEIRDNLPKYGIKIHQIAEGFRKHPDQVTLIFFENVKSGGGCINIALILESLRREDGRPLFHWVRNPNEMKTPREPNDPYRLVVFSSLPGTTHGKDANTMLTISNQPENRYGAYCNLIIISRQSATGVNIKNIRRFYQSPYFNMSLSRQASGRSERAGGHDALPKNERFINQYMLVAVNPGKTKLPLGGPTVSLEPTIDTYVHSIAESKDRKNADALRASIESCWDCALTYGRNVISEAIDGSPECFYQDCNYYCDGYDRQLIDESSKPWTYSSDLQKMDYSNTILYYAVRGQSADESYPNSGNQVMTKKIEELFRHYFVLSLDGIIQLTNGQSQYHQYIILDVLDNFITNHVPITNRYGQKNYLREEQDWYYLTPHLTDSTLLDCTMTSSPLLEKSQSLQHILIGQMYQSDLLRMREIWTASDYTKSAIETLHYVSIIGLIETTIHQAPQLGPTLHQLYPSHIQPWPDPTNKESTAWVHNFNVIDYYHRGLPPTNVYIQKYKETAKKTDQILPYYRILDPEHGAPYWIYPGDGTLQKQIHALFAPVAKAQKTTKTITREDIPGGVFGFVNDHGKFSIRQIQEPGKRITSGGVCMEKTWVMTRLVALLIDLNYYPPASGQNLKLSRKEMKESLVQNLAEWTPSAKIQNLTREQMASLVTVAEWKKQDLCSAIQKWMSEQNPPLLLTFE